MPTLMIRDLPSNMVERLKARGRQNGRSMEQEARKILEQRLIVRVELLSEMRSRWDDIAKSPSASEVSSWIEAGRRRAE